MIVPRNRLLLWTAAMVPVAAAGTTLPEASAPALAATGALLLLALVDAALARGPLRGLRVEVPGVVRLFKDREGKVPLVLRHAAGPERLLKVGLSLPAGFRAPAEAMEALLPAGAEGSRIEWACTPPERGTFRLGDCGVEAASPLGFWSARARLPAGGELRVYPNLAGERKNLAALFLNRGRFGVHTQRMVGRGRDFEELREYLPGDGYDQIHWKATAKRGRPVTKLFQVERTQEVYVAIDHSRLSGRRVGGFAALERSVNAALVLGLAAERQGDLFGLLTFGDRVRGFVRARNGKAHYHACRDALFALQPQPVAPDFADVCAFVRLRLRRRALLVVLTDLDDPVLSEKLVRHVRLISRQHLVLLGVPRSPSAAPLYEGEPPDSLDAIYRRLGGHLLWRRLREQARTLQRHGVKTLFLDHERTSAQLVTEYLAIKQRQLL
jgi:uncharacterized protein (DUF58 family)